MKTTALYIPALFAALADYYMPAPITPLARYTNWCMFLAQTKPRFTCRDELVPELRNAACV